MDKSRFSDSVPEQLKLNKAQQTTITQFETPHLASCKETFHVKVLATDELLGKNKSACTHNHTFYASKKTKTKTDNV